MHYLFAKKLLWFSFQRPVKAADVAAMRITYPRNGAHTHILPERVWSSSVMDSFMVRNIPTYGTQFVPLKCCASISA